MHGELLTIFNKEQAFFNSFFTRGLNIPIHRMIEKDYEELYGMLWTNDYQLKFNKTKPVMAHVGTWTGMETMILGSYAASKGGKVYAIDCHKGLDGTPLMYYGKYLNIKNILLANIDYFNLQNTIEVIDRPINEVIKRFRDNTFDFILLGTEPKYSILKDDVDMWFPKLRMNGVLAIHDWVLMPYEGVGDRSKWNKIDLQYNRIAAYKVFINKFKHIQITFHRTNIWYKERK